MQVSVCHARVTARHLGTWVCMPALPGAWKAKARGEESPGFKANLHNKGRAFSPAKPTVWSQKRLSG